MKKKKIDLGFHSVFSTLPKGRSAFMLLREQTCDSNTVLKMNRIMEITIDSFLGHTLAMTKAEIMAQRGQALCEMSHIKLTMTPRIIRTERSPVFKAMGEKN